MALSKKCPSCGKEYRFLLQCSDCSRQYCNKCSDYKVDPIPIPRKYDHGPCSRTACPKCGSDSFELISEINDDDSDDTGSSNHEETSSESSYDSSDYSGSSDSSYSWSDGTLSGGTSATSSSGSGTGILSIVALIAIFLFFKYGSVGTRQQTNPVVVSPSPTPTISENESVEHTQLPVTLSVSPQEVTALKFYESGYNFPPPNEQRLYATSFYQNSVRYIYWELTLQTPRQESNLPFNIIAVWTGPNGNPEFARQNNAITAPVNSDSWLASSGWGNPNNNGFQPGMYEITFYSDGRQIANGSVEVLSGSEESETQAQETAAPEPPPPQPAPLSQPGVIAQPQPYVQPRAGVIVGRPRHYIQIMPHPRNYAPSRPRIR